jgi:hypothetical protein
MNRTIISLSILAVLAAGTAAKGHGHGGGHGGGGHHGGASHHHGGGYGYTVGVPLGVGVPFQPTFNAGQVWPQAAQAAVNYQVAYGMYLDNCSKGVNVRFERRQLNAAHRAKMRHPMRTNPQIEIRQSSTPRQATAITVSADGTIDWPDLLCDARYKAQRDTLEAVLAKGAAAPAAGLDRDDRRRVEMSRKELLAELKRHVGEANANDWIAAKRFVDRLTLEAGHTLVEGHVAGR